MQLDRFGDLLGTSQR